jgi:DNA replication protein DnaC
MRAPAPTLAADLDAGLRRLKLAAIRRLAPELCQTAKVQRWAPEEFLRGLVEAELVARDEANYRNRLRQAAFPPLTRPFEEYKLAPHSSMPRATFDYLASLDWIRSRLNLCCIGPAGTGKSFLLVGLGQRAVAAGMRVRYFVAPDLLEHLYRGLADNSVGRLIDQLLRADLILIDDLGFTPLDTTGGQLLFRLVAAAYERRSLGLASHFPFEQWSEFLPQQATAVALLDRLLHHNVLVITGGDSFRMQEARARGGGQLLTT